MSDNDVTATTEDVKVDPGDSRWTALHHTEREWDEMSTHIIRLYLDEQMTLGEVMRVMETEYNFKASQSMYKKRISRWQLHKYKPRTRPNAARQKTALARGKSQRVAVVSTHYERAALSPRLNDGTTDRTVRDLFISLRRLTLLHSKSHPMGQPENEIGMGPSGILGITQMYSTFSIGSALFAKGHGHLAGKAVRQAFLILEEIIRGAHFGLDWLILDLLYDFVARCQYALYSTLVTHLANIADALLPRSHPLHHIAAALLRYGNQEDGDTATMLQRAFFCQIDAVQSDTEVRATLTAMNRRVRHFLIPDEPPQVTDDKLHRVRQGIRAIHYEIETQKDLGAELKRKRKKKRERSSESQLPSPQSSPQSSSQSNTTSTPSSSSSSPPAPLPMLPALSTMRSDSGDDAMLLRDFIEQRTKRSLARMDKKLDLLTLGIADRLYWSEFTPDLVDLYLSKARSFELRDQGEWAAAAREQKKVLDIQKDKFAMDVWGIIRELWALEKLLQKAGAPETMVAGVRDEALSRATQLLVTIPDDVP